MQRRQLLKSTAAFSAATFYRRPAIAQTPKKISFLTWNLVHLEAQIKGWIQGFTRTRPGVEVEWIDKKGPELPAFYQTQLAAGTPPDIIDIQGALGLEYAAQGALARPHAAASPPRPRSRAATTRTISRTGCSRARTTWCRSTSPRRCCSATRRCSRRRASTGRRRASTRSSPLADKIKGGEKTGFLTLNFDWLYWPLMQDERRRAAVAGPQERRPSTRRRRPRC